MKIILFLSFGWFTAKRKIRTLEWDCLYTPEKFLGTSVLADS